MLVAGALVLVCAIVLGLPLSGSAQSLTSQIQTELKTAVFHSGELAQRVNALAGVQLHLHHTLNCLEGPSGADFFPAAGNPCQGQGTGVIPDLKIAVAHMVPGAQAALQEAQTCQMLVIQALGSKDINEAQPFALVVSRHLQAASQDLGQ